MAIGLSIAALLGSPLGTSPSLASGSEALWLPPLGFPLQVTTPYDLPHGPYRAGHRGIDLPASPGDAVRAPADGTVSFSGNVVDRRVLSIRTDARTVVSFEPLSSELQPGDAVARGQSIGVVGDGGGHCDGNCLHLGVRVDGAYVNPLRFLMPRAELVPW